MSFRGLLTTTIAIAVGYVAARQLLSDEAPQQLERLPEGARGPLVAARGRLIAGRARARLALREGQAEAEAAEAELIREYRRATNR